MPTKEKQAKNITFTSLDEVHSYFFPDEFAAENEERANPELIGIDLARKSIDTISRKLISKSK